MLLLVKDSPQGKKCLPPAEKSAYREEKKLLTAQRKKSLPCGEKTAYRVVVNLPYHPHTVADHLFGVMLEGHHEVRKHTVYLSASGIVASMPRNKERFTFTIITTDYSFAIIPEDE